MPQSVMANGTIQPNRFVKLDSGTPSAYKVLQCTANSSVPYGISQDGSLDPPGVNGSATDAARAGTELQIYVMNDICLLQVGSGGWTEGDFLMSDASGQGVTQTSTNPIGAIALATQSAGDFGRVRVLGPQANG